MAPKGFTSIIAGSVLGNFEAANKTYRTIAQIPTIITVTAILNDPAVIPIILPIILQERHTLNNHFKLTAA